VTLNPQPNPTTSPNGNSLYWDFTWNNAQPGSYQPPDWLEGEGEE